MQCVIICHTIWHMCGSGGNCVSNLLWQSSHLYLKTSFIPFLETIYITLTKWICNQVRLLVIFNDIVPHSELYLILIMLPRCKFIQDHVMKIFKHLDQTIYTFFNQISLCVMFLPHVFANPQPQTFITHSFPWASYQIRKIPVIIRDVNAEVHVLISQGPLTRK